MNCFENLIKYIMFFVNALFVLAGIVLIGFGAYAQIKSKNVLNFVGDNYTNTPIAIVVLGVIIFAIAFFGCCGTCKDNKCMMYTYGILLAVVLIAQVGGGIAAFAMKGDLEQEITKNMRGGLEHFADPGYEGVTNTWNLVQANFKCCGVENYKDWEKRYPTNGTAPGTVPDSCCKAEKENCGVRPDPSSLWADGCFSKFSQTFTDNLSYVGIVAVCIAAAELLTIAFACCLGRRMGSDSRYV